MVFVTANRVTFPISRTVSGRANRCVSMVKFMAAGVIFIKNRD